MTGRFDSIIRVLLILALAVPLVVIPWVLFPFVFAKALYFQTLVAAAAGLFLVSRRARFWFPRDQLAVVTVAFLLSAVVSSVLGVDSRRSFLGSEERSMGLLLVVHAAIFFFLVRSVFEKNKQWLAAGRAAVVFSGILAMVAIVQVAVFERTGIRILGIDAGGRAAGFLGNPVFFGVFAPLAAIWMILIVRRDSLPWKIIAVVSLLSLLVADYLTRSRGAHLSVLVGVGAGIIVAALFSSNRRLRKVTAGIIVSTALVGIVLFALRQNPTVARLPVIGPIINSSFQSGTLGTRTLAWRVALVAFQDHPIIGWGSDVFHLAFNAHYDPRFLEFSYYETWFDRAHNAFLDILVMQGAVGAIVLVTAVVVVILGFKKAFFRGRFDAVDAGVIAGGLVGYVVADLAAFDNPATAVYLAFILAYVSWAAWGKESKTENQILKIGRTSVWKVVGVAVPALVVIVVFNIVPALVSAKTRAMAERFIVRDDAAGLRVFHELLDRWTIYPEEPRIDGAVTLTGMMTEPGYNRERFDAEFPLVRRAVDDLVRLHPRHAYYWYLRGRAFSEASRFDPSYKEEAERSFARADKLSPNRQQIAYAQGKLYLTHKEIDRALELMEKMVALDSKVAQSHWYYGLALVEAGEESRGGEELIVAGELGYDPQTVGEALLLRELFLKRNNGVLTAEYAQKAADLEPTAGRFAEAAAAYAAIGDDESARKSVRRAVELDPTYADEARTFLELLKSGALRTATSTP